MKNTQKSQIAKKPTLKKGSKNGFQALPYSTVCTCFVQKDKNILIMRTRKDAWWD